ncbi:MAG: hypothetical protein WA882_02425 [Geitlerinemataceae cyanobacterium]
MLSWLGLSEILSDTSCFSPHLAEFWINPKTRPKLTLLLSRLQTTSAMSQGF